MAHLPCARVGARAVAPPIGRHGSGGIGVTHNNHPGKNTEASLGMRGRGHPTDGARPAGRSPSASASGTPRQPVAPAVARTERRGAGLTRGPDLPGGTPGTCSSRTRGPGGGGRGRGTRCWTAALIRVTVDRLGVIACARCKVCRLDLCPAQANQEFGRRGACSSPAAVERCGPLLVREAPSGRLPPASEREPSRPRPAPGPPATPKGLGGGRAAAEPRS
jgi:hypothetical protein